MPEVSGLSLRGIGALESQSKRDEACRFGVPPVEVLFDGCAMHLGPVVAGTGPVCSGGTRSGRSSARGRACPRRPTGGALQHRPARGAHRVMGAVAAENAAHVVLQVHVRLHRLDLETGLSHQSDVDAAGVIALEEPYVLVRPVEHLVVEPGHVLANHFKSQSGGGGTQRQRQAAAVRSIATELVDAGESVVVLGDLNEGPETAGEPPTNLATLFDLAGPLRSCYDLPGFDVGPRLGTFDSCGLQPPGLHLHLGRPAATVPRRFGISKRAMGQSEDAAHSLGRVSGHHNWYAAGVRPFRAVCAPQPLNAVASTSGVAPFRRTGLTARSGYLLDGFVELVGCQEVMSLLDAPARDVSCLPRSHSVLRQHSEEHAGMPMLGCFRLCRIEDASDDLAVVPG